MRTALLAAVSHDLRTPLASIKASVSSLRQTDVTWTEADQQALLATIEEDADRLDGLIGNLLDMSRLQTGALQPFLRPVALDEVAPVALRGLDAPADCGSRSPTACRWCAPTRGCSSACWPTWSPTRCATRRRPCRRCCGAPGSGHRRDRGRRPRAGRAGRLRRGCSSRSSGSTTTHSGGLGLGLAVAGGFTEAMGGTRGAPTPPAAG